MQYILQVKKADSNSYWLKVSIRRIDEYKKILRHWLHLRTVPELTKISDGLYSTEIIRWCQTFNVTITRV